MKLLTTGAFPYTEEHFNEFRELGFEVYQVQDERIPLNQQEINFHVADIDAVICNALFLYNDIDDFRNLKLIQLTSVGLDRVPLEKIKSKGIILENARGAYSIPMAEYAVAGVLQLIKHMRQFADAQKRRSWEKDREIGELAGCTVCILGCGNVGTECAKRFRAFDCHVIGIARTPETIISNHYNEVVPVGALDDTLGRCDILILSVPLTEHTFHLMNKERFEACKPGMILVNIARGSVVETDALVEALENKRLSGAVLDVFEKEPLMQDSLLWNRDNVVITPHNSFVGENNHTRLGQLILNNLNSCFATSHW